MQGQVDFGFPVTEEAELVEAQNEHAGAADVSYFNIISSPGYAIFSDLDIYNTRASALTLQVLLEAWPIFAFTFLLAGIAGVFIWAGVSPSCYNGNGTADVQL